jgi:hypothetical protein
VAAPFEFMRVDFYVLGERVLIGELTSSPGAGLGRFYPPAFSEELASHWVLPSRDAGSASETIAPPLPDAEANASSISARMAR